MKKYQDFVIKNGEFVGAFEEMYAAFEDPWLQSSQENVFDSRRLVAKNWIKKLAAEGEVRAVEIGCGFGHITSDLCKEGIDCVGIDISRTAIKKARLLHQDCQFEVAEFDDFGFYKDRGINVFLMAEVTWYVLPRLEKFIHRLKRYRQELGAEVHLIHLLSTYAEGKQKYGVEYFTDLESILDYFDFDYEEFGYVAGGKKHDPNSRGTYFVAKI